MFNVYLIRSDSLKNRTIIIAKIHYFLKILYLHGEGNIFKNALKDEFPSTCVYSPIISKSHRLIVVKNPNQNNTFQIFLVSLV